MRVWVTRDESADGPLCTALRALGLDIVLEPVVERRVVADPAALLAGLSADDWLILTSPYAIDAVANVPAARVPQVAVVGESSRERALAAGMRVALVGEDGHGATMFDALHARVTRGVVCYPRSAQAKSPEAWGAVELRSPVLYDTLPRTFDATAVRDVDIAVVASPSAVRAIGDLAVPLASIGRVTTAAIERTGRTPVVEAPYPTFEQLAQAVADYLRSSRHQRA